MQPSFATQFVAECFWPGVREADLSALDQRVAARAAELTLQRRERSVSRLAPHAPRRGRALPIRGLRDIGAACCRRGRDPIRTNPRGRELAVARRGFGLTSSDRAKSSATTPAARIGPKLIQRGGRVWRRACSHRSNPTTAACCVSATDTPCTGRRVATPRAYLRCFCTVDRGRGARRISVVSSIRMRTTPCCSTSADPAAAGLWPASRMQT